MHATRKYELARQYFLSKLSEAVFTMDSLISEWHCETLKITLVLPQAMGAYYIYVPVNVSHTESHWIREGALNVCLCLNDRSANMMPLE